MRVHGRLVVQCSNLNEGRLCPLDADLDGMGGASAIPDVIDDEHAPALQGVGAGKGQKPGLGHAEELIAGIGVEQDGGGEQVAELEGLAHEGGRDEAAARDGEHDVEALGGGGGGKVAAHGLDLRPRDVLEGALGGGLGGGVEGCAGERRRAVRGEAAPGEGGSVRSGRERRGRGGEGGAWRGHWCGGETDETDEMDG